MKFNNIYMHLAMVTGNLFNIYDDIFMMLKTFKEKTR